MRCDVVTKSCCGGRTTTVRLATVRPRWPTSRPAARIDLTPDQREETPTAGSPGRSCGVGAPAHAPLRPGSPRRPASGPQAASGSRVVRRRPCGPRARSGAASRALTAGVSSPPIRCRSASVSGLAQPGRVPLGQLRRALHLLLLLPGQRFGVLHAHLVVGRQRRLRRAQQAQQRLARCCRSPARGSSGPPARRCGPSRRGPSGWPAPSCSACALPAGPAGRARRRSRPRRASCSPCSSARPTSSSSAKSLPCRPQISTWTGDASNRCIRSLYGRLIDRPGVQRNGARPGHSCPCRRSCRRPTDA